MSSIEKALEGLVGLITNARRPLPDALTLNGFVPVLDGIKREPRTNIVMQYQEGNEEKPLDGGDSAHRTGVLAFCGSQIDAENLGLFFNSGLMVRHPTQEPWNNPNNCSRDQLIGYLAGCWRDGRTEIAVSLLNSHRDRGWICQNTENDAPGTTKNPPLGDPLGPHHMMFLRICAGDLDAATDLVSQLALYTAIQTASNDVESEQNQLLLLSIICCQLDLYVAAQSKYKDALMHYWGGEPWRGQRSIATNLINVVDLELSRYSTPDILDYLIPANILDELRHINLQDAVNALRNGNPLYFTELAGKLAIAALRDIEHYVKVVLYGLRTLKNIAEEVANGILKILNVQASKEVQKIVGLLGGIDPSGLVSVALTTAASILGLGSSRSDAEDAAEKQFRQDAINKLQLLLSKSSEILTKMADLQKSMEQGFSAIVRAMDEGFYKLVLNELKARARTVEILINSLAANPSADEAVRLRKDLGTQVQELKVAIGKMADEGSAALPACFHAFGIVMAALSVLNNEKELVETRIGFRPVFKSLLAGKAGLQSTIIGLNNEISSAYSAFDKSRAKMLIGAVSVRKAEQRNMDSTKDITPIEGYWVTKVFCTVSGSIESGNFSLSFSPEDAGDSLAPLVVTDGQEGNNVFSGAIFENAPWYGGLNLSKYHSPDFRELQIAARDAGVAKIIRDAGPLVQGWLQEKRSKLVSAKSAKPGYETLSAAVAATFLDASDGVPA